LYVEDDLRVGAGQASCEEKRHKLVHALNEGLRAEESQLTLDPPRQQEVEERPVECARARGGNQLEALVLRRPAVRRGRKQSMIDDLRDSIPFPLLRR
jgi:hypothetical protein